MLSYLFYANLSIYICTYTCRIPLAGKKRLHTCPTHQSKKRTRNPALTLTSCRLSYLSYSRSTVLPPILSILDNMKSSQFCFTITRRSTTSASTHRTRIQQEKTKDKIQCHQNAKLLHRHPSNLAINLASSSHRRRKERSTSTRNKPTTRAFESSEPSRSKSPTTHGDSLSNIHQAITKGTLETSNTTRHSSSDNIEPPTSQSSKLNPSSRKLTSPNHVDSAIPMEATISFPNHQMLPLLQ